MVPHASTKADASAPNLVTADSTVKTGAASASSCSLKYAASEVFCNPNPAKSKSGSSANQVNTAASSTMLPNRAANAFTAINIDSLEDERTRESMQKYNESFMIPLNPDKNINMKLNQQQVQINIKY